MTRKLEEREKRRLQLLQACLFLLFALVLLAVLVPMWWSVRGEIEALERRRSEYAEVLERNGRLEEARWYLRHQIDVISRIYRDVEGPAKDLP